MYHNEACNEILLALLRPLLLFLWLPAWLVTDTCKAKCSNHRQVNSFSIINSYVSRFSSSSSTAVYLKRLQSDFKTIIFMLSLRKIYKNTPKEARGKIPSILISLLSQLKLIMKCHPHTHACIPTHTQRTNKIKQRRKSLLSLLLLPSLLFSFLKYCSMRKGEKERVSLLYLLTSIKNKDHREMIWE